MEKTQTESSSVIEELVDLTSDTTAAPSEDEEEGDVQTHTPPTQSPLASKTSKAKASKFSKGSKQRLLK